MSTFHRRFISVQEAARYLSLAPKSIYRMVLQGTLPSVKIGRARRVDLVKLEKMLNVQIADDRN